ncbi:MAG: TrbI/VirB10 family protein [Legionella sp.]
MAKFNINVKERYQQYKNLMSVVGIVVVVLFVIITLFSDGAPKHEESHLEKGVFEGVIDDTFSEANAESAITSQQMDILDLTKKVSELTEQLQKNRSNPAQLDELEKKLTKQISEELKSNQLASLEQPFKNDNVLNDAPSELALAQAWNNAAPYQKHQSKPIHTVSFHYASHKKPTRYKKTPDNYVPSGTFANAVILGGADADASVNGERQNNGVMLFKIVSDGVLPNNQRSHLKGCFVTGSTYGDISSERAYVVLDKLSCAQQDRPLLDKSVTGWAFFAGKAGIKGKATMRDGKIMAWAGVSGALSGVAQAAQAAQSIQNITPYGATSILPSNRVAGFAGLGGTSKAADQLSNYYIRRAEQYHPIIQVGSGNLVNIVFKDGFSLLPEEDEKEQMVYEETASRHDSIAHASKEAMIPETLLNEMNKQGVSYDLGSQISQGGQP